MSKNYKLKNFIVCKCGAKAQQKVTINNINSFNWCGRFDCISWKNFYKSLNLKKGEPGSLEIFFAEL